MKRIELTWQLGHHKANQQPAEYFPATVPGGVQLDYATAHNWPPYWYADHFRDYEWMEDEFWTYRTTFQVQPDNDKSVFFSSKGIDYEFDIFLNGQVLHKQEGMFTRVFLDLTPHLQAENELLVRIHPAPKKHRDTVDRSQADQSCKPPVSYGWDWHPRLIPLGIWDETCLVIRSQACLQSHYLSYQLQKNNRQAEVKLAVDLGNANGLQFEWIVLDKEGNPVIQEKCEAREHLTLNAVVENPNLWWTHDHGEPYLYTAVLRLLDAEQCIDEQQFRIGFKSVRLVMNKGAWDEPAGFPKSRSVPPIQLELNGANIFCKGSNWVPPYIFPGLFNEENYHQLLSKAKNANMNMLRVWGGGYINKDVFYDLCDELGILVWQEFPLSSNEYDGTPEYLQVLRQESESIITRLREHACLAIWCGGNELFNVWAGMTDQSAALRLLNSQCFLLDPDKPFLMTSPLTGMGHGHYVFKDSETNKDVFQLMAESRFTAYTEFGMPSPSNLEVLNSFLSDDVKWPPRPETTWESHHAFNAWIGDTWLMQPLIESYFGKCENAEQLVECGQLLQCEGYKCIFEEARRQKPYCSMALNWCFNEPWPTAANNSLINWPDKEKSALKAVADACRPIVASARIPKFTWEPDETFYADIFLLNDTLKSMESGEIEILLKGDERQHLLTWRFPDCAPNSNAAGPTVRFRLPVWTCERLQLLLVVAGHPEWNSQYTILLRQKIVNEQSGARRLNE